ncbi:hypothetical protein MP228_010976 [Amoeboaphelidium protococcarum]|nr:hypothetical protein MP228_010976 [Amoeboaphelidium protococcarum]
MLASQQDSSHSQDIPSATYNPYVSLVNGLQTIQVPHFVLEDGRQFSSVPVGYKTWGTFDGENLIIVCHAISGSPDVESWWGDQIGSGKTFDPDRDFIVCLNAAGSPYGSISPLTADPTSDGKRYGASFPTISIRDSVRLHKMALDMILGTDTFKISAVVGASLGGMYALEWAASYPAVVYKVISIACGLRQSAWGIALCECQRLCIQSDQAYAQGDYYYNIKSQVDGRSNIGQQKSVIPWNQPVRGLANARMQGMISYKSPVTFNVKFGRTVYQCDEMKQHRYHVESCVFSEADCSYSESEDSKFNMQTYLRYQGSKFVERFDANCYIALTKQLDTHDILRNRDINAVFDSNLHMLIIGVDSDILYPVSDQEEIVQLASSNGCNAQLIVINSSEGHDGFLTEHEQVSQYMQQFLKSPKQ